MILIIAAVTSILLALPLLYRYFLFPTIKKSPSLNPTPFNSKSLAFEKQRRATFPPPYPNGWYKLCDVTDLDNAVIASKPISVSAFGQDLVLWKNHADGQITVMDAFCPHMGTHLGNGEVTKEGRLKCPFHGWEFGTSGVCQHIPYCTSSPPYATQTTAKRWTHRVHMGMVFVWFDAEGREPLYELESLGPKHTWERVITRQSEYRMHMSDMAENSADYYHFNYLHGPMPIPIIGRFLTIRHETKLFFPEEPERKHICFFNNIATVYFLKKFKLEFTKQLTRVTFEGPTVVHFDITTPLGSVALMKTNIPLSPFHIYSEDAWFKEPKTPRWLLHVIAYIARGALEQDRIVWESRRYNPKPAYVAGDGPFPTHRRW
eukprot:PhF_6_TR30610/c0_g1_i3/m.45070/K14938/NVD, DAF36; cholesterol 7-desaturase